MPRKTAFRRLIPPILPTFLMMLSAPLLAQDCDSKTYASTPTDQFRVHDDGTVTDSKSKLTWMRCALGMKWQGDTCVGVAARYEWLDAGRYIKRMNAGGGYAGHSDWRLPSLKELEGIVEHRCINPSINLEVFPATLPTGFWSATREEGYDKGIWLVYFLHGKSYMGNVAQEWKVRLVRDAR